MTWNNYIITKSLSRQQMLVEFDHFISKIKEMSNDKIHVLFSFAWGVAAYGENSDWIIQTMSEKDLLTKISKLENQNEGSIGTDDLYLTYEGSTFEIQFCHESDVHIWFNESNEFIDQSNERWKDLGYSPELHSEK